MIDEIFNDREKFVDVKTNVHLERQHRLNNAKNILTFGVKFLDDCLGGIMSNDLVVFGARTGAGKTELATIIAGANAAKGKRVHMFALEAEPFEIERRLKYQVLSRLFYSVLRKDKAEMRTVNLNYLDWYMGKLDSYFSEYEPEIQEHVAHDYETLRVLYSTKGYSVEKFEQELLSIQDETDLIIIDHLHYFNLEDGANENSEITRITKKIRELSLLLSKPIVLLVHLRKSDRKSKLLIPDEEDFHGSSNISKIATKIFTLAKANVEIPSKIVFPTYIRPVKCRPDGSRTRYVGVCSFNGSTNSYDTKYNIGQLSFDGTEVKEVLDPPHWFPKETFTDVRINHDKLRMK